nr:hypothetical protein [Tanacetum cinerariifolium]
GHGGVDDGGSSGGGSGWMVCVDWGDVGVVMDGVACGGDDDYDGGCGDGDGVMLVRVSWW